MATLFTKQAFQLAVQVLFGYHGGEQQELAAAAGISPASLSNYLSGRSAPPLRTLRKLARAAGVGAGRLERVLESLNELCAEPAGPGEHRHGASRRLGEARAAAAGDLLATSLPVRGGAPDPRPLDERWAILAKLSLEAARAVIEETAELQDPALCERFCAESERLAASDAARAVRLAEIAVCIADQVALEGPSWQQLEATALSYRAHARRVRGDLDAAEADFREADRFWNFATPEGARAPQSRLQTEPSCFLKSAPNSWKNFQIPRQDGNEPRHREILREKQP